VVAAGDCSDDHFWQGEVDAAHVARSSWGDWTVCRRSPRRVELPLARQPGNTIDRPGLHDVDAAWPWPSTPQCLKANQFSPGSVSTCVWNLVKIAVKLWAVEHVTCNNRHLSKFRTKISASNK